MSSHPTDELPVGVDEPDEQDDVEAKKRSFWRDLPGLLFTAVLIAVLIKTFLFQPFWIPSESMSPTIDPYDRVMVNKVVMNFADVHRGDIVVFRDPSRPHVEESLLQAARRSFLEALGISTRGHEDLIKRVIALPGETVRITNNTVFIDDVPLDEPYIANGSNMNDMQPVTLGDEEVFVMGDNRNASHDSTNFGPIPIEDVVGKAFWRIWPLGRFGGL